MSDMATDGGRVWVRIHRGGWCEHRGGWCEPLVRMRGGGYIEPHGLARVVSRGERQLVANLGRAVEVVRRRLDPRVVGRARIIDVSAVDDAPMLEELVDSLLEGIRVCALDVRARLLHKLALHRERHVLACVDKAALSTQGPLSNMGG